MVSGSSKVLRRSALVYFLLMILYSLSYSELIDRVVASVNGEPILESEVKVAQIFYGEDDYKKVLDTLIEKHMITQFLESKGFRLSPEYMDQVLKDIANRNYNGSLERLYTELYKNNLTPSDLKNFLRIELTSTIGLRQLLLRQVKVSDIEVELELLKMGKIRYLRLIKLLILEKDKKEEILRAVSLHGEDIDKIAEFLGVKVETLKVAKGDLVEDLDREVWRARIGDLVIAEDENYVYFAKIEREIREVEGVDEEKVKEEILERKLKESINELMTKLKKNSVVEIYI